MRSAAVTVLLAAAIAASACGASGITAPTAPSAPLERAAIAPAPSSVLSDDTGALLSAPSPVLRSRAATVNLAAVRLGSQAVADSLVVNLFRDAEYTARLEQLQTTGIGDAWIGSIPAVPGSQVIVAISSGVASISVSLPTAYYSVLPAASGGYVVAQVDRSLLPPL